MRPHSVNKDILAGFIFIAFAALFGSNALKLPIGTSLRMGPGYFPIILSCVLAMLGLLILLKGLRIRSEPMSPMHWRGLIAICSAVAIFGVLVQPLGFLAALAICVLISLLASSLIGPVSGFLLIVGLVAFCWAVFIWAIKLPWPILGPWLGGY